MSTPPYRADHVRSLLRPGMYLSKGRYDSVAEKLFSRTNVDHFLLELDTPRAGGFASPRFLANTPVLESMEDVLKRAKLTLCVEAARQIWG